MCHTRAPTTGKIAKENSHPFEFGNIVGAHNGIIHNHEQLNRQYDRKFEVDSMHIFAHMAEGKELSDLRGYGAIEFVRSENPDIICLAKISSTGSLAIFETAYGIFWSSDDDHLKAALDAGGLKYKEYEVKEHVEYFTQKGQVFVDKSIKHKLETTVVTRFHGNGHYIGADMNDWFDKKDKEEPWKDAKYWERNDDKTKAVNVHALIGAGPRNSCAHGVPINIDCKACAIDSAARVITPMETAAVEAEGRCTFCRAVVVESMCIDMCNDECTGAEKFEAMLMSGELP